MELRPARPCAPPATPRCTAIELMERRDIPVEDHVILQSNVARYVSKLPPDLRDTASVEEQLKKLKTGVPPHLGRWLVKVRRDLDTPRTDTQTWARAEVLSGELRDLKGCYPGIIYVVGGLAAQDEGRNVARFGGNSDLDLVGVGLISEEQADAMEEKGLEVDADHPDVARGVRSQNGLSALFYQTEEKAREALQWFGDHLEVPPQGIDLVEHLQESFRNQGVIVEPPG